MSTYDSATGVYVWKVIFDYVFSSSSAGKPYSHKHEKQHATVITTSDSLSAIKAQIQSEVLDGQSRFQYLHEATFIGNAFLPSEFVKRSMMNEDGK